MAANSVVNIPRSYQSWAALAATPPDFCLDAGNYGMTVLDGGFESYMLQRLLPDGATYAPATPVMAAAGYNEFKLPAGQYTLVLVGPTSFTGVLEKIDAGRIR